MKGIWRAGTAVAIFASVLATPAMASAAAAPEAGEPAAGADQAAAAPQAGLQEIVVTAQRRSEKLQNVPISITAANADALATARVENVSNIGAITPSVTFRVTNIASSSANVVIRGLGTAGISRSFEGSVGVFIDGVYRTRAGAALQDFLDIDNLQVLRGAQGTLFGKNTTAGALLLASTKPSTSDIGGSFEADVGNYNTYSIRAAINVPLASNLALRVAGLGSGTDGFFTDVNTGRPVNGNTTRAVKGQLLWEPSSSVTVRLIGDYSSSHGDCCYATERVTAGPTAPLVDYLTTALGLKLPSTDISKFQVSLNQLGYQSTKDYGGALLVDAAIGAGMLKSVTAYRRFDVVQLNEDADFSGADILPYDEDFHSDFASQELTYNTRIPSLNADIVIGGFVSTEKLKSGRSLYNGLEAQPYWNTVLGAYGLPAGTADATPGLIESEGMHGSTDSYAVFAHGDFKVTDQFSVIGGLRYSIEHKRGSFAYTYLNGIPNDWGTLLNLFPAPAYDVGHTDKAVSGTFGLQYKLTPDAMVYGTYNRGFKAGGVNMDQNAAGGVLNNAAAFATLPPMVQYLVTTIAGTTNVTAPLDPTYKPETINAFELGAKVQYFGHRARTNVSLFYYDLKNLQIAQFVGLRFTVLNAKSATDYGAEIENTFQLSPALTLNADATWIPHAQYGVDANIDPALSGSRFRFAPKITANAGLTLDTPLTDKLDLIGRVQYQYASSQYVNVASNNVQGPVGLLNANLGVKIDRRYTLEGWVQNLTNKTYVTQVFETPLQTGTQNAYMGSPRTFGVRLHGTF
ncbi:TonB-dependent receptor [Novosphingobium sp. Fuku2-ISO-50]|uniref:TonB-dependent receptor n=1 Tax=Novosphingobium sp. Fuku2-ISO-50 TaxID=1739114 RepID=UPI00076C9ADA|nr:TonB-dependent receptor [Novosphingobium sp. Fuku2-ISO-50]KUR75062.1 TonB-dependent receptor [Novosphingobium sp. Fuku2-ISO-50]